MDQTAAIMLFVRVVDLGSISAAARHLDLSPAVASQRLKQLEQQLGVRLLHRTTRQLTPTPEGQLLLEEGRALVEDLEALTARLRLSSTGAVGTLRVTMSSTFGRLFVAPLLPEYLAANPALRISVDFTDEQVDLVGAGYDLAIRIGALEDSSLVARKIASDSRILCASPGYLAHHGEPATPEQLEQHECLLMAGRNSRHHVWRLVDAVGKTTAVCVKGRLESNQGELLRDAAVAGLGIAMHSTWHIREDLESGALVRVLPGYTLEETGIYAVMPQRRLVPSRVRSFVDFLSERFSRNDVLNSADGAHV